MEYFPCLEIWELVLYVRVVTILFGLCRWMSAALIKLVL